MKGLLPALRERAVLALLVASALYAFARVPHATWRKRLAQVEEQRRLGSLGYNIGRSWPEIAEIVRWIRAHTDDDAILLWSGHWKGPLELVAASIGERLLYEEALAPADLVLRGELRGRAIARGTRGGARGVLVLLADGERIELVVRS